MFFYCTSKGKKMTAGHPYSTTSECVMTNDRITSTPAGLKLTWHTIPARLYLKHTDASTYNKLCDNMGGHYETEHKITFHSVTLLHPTCSLTASRGSTSSWNTNEVEINHQVIVTSREKVVGAGLDGGDLKGFRKLVERCNNSASVDNTCVIILHFCTGNSLNCHSRLQTRLSTFPKTVFSVNSVYQHGRQLAGATKQNTWVILTGSSQLWSPCWNLWTLPGHFIENVHDFCHLRLWIRLCFLETSVLFSDLLTNEQELRFFSFKKCK